MHHFRCSLKLLILIVLRTVISFPPIFNILHLNNMPIILNIRLYRSKAKNFVVIHWASWELDILEGVIFFSSSAGIFTGEYFIIACLISNTFLPLFCNSLTIFCWNLVAKYQQI